MCLDQCTSSCGMLSADQMHPLSVALFMKCVVCTLYMFDIFVGMHGNLRYAGIPRFVVGVCVWVGVWVWVCGCGCVGVHAYMSRMTLN